jgi:hypothetical protein
LYEDSVSDNDTFYEIKIVKNNNIDFKDDKSVGCELIKQTNSDKPEILKNSEVNSINTDKPFKQEVCYTKVSKSAIFKQYFS